MQCLHPLRLFDTGTLTPKGKPAYIFDSTGTDSISPDQAARCGYRVTHWLRDYVEVPCGHCVACRINHARVWSFRCLAELATTEGRSSFLTLTYDDSCNPGVLVKKDLQDFNKRLRKRCGPFRFYACGEYGDSTHRPHFHGIYFGLSFKDAVLYKSRGDASLFTSKSLNECWGHGFAVIGSVTPASCSYVSGYIGKKYQTPGIFQLMSRRPGIGLSYFRANSKAGDFVALPSGNGGVVRGSVPRSAFPLSDFKRLGMSDVDFTGLGKVDPKALDDWRWAMDACLKRPRSHRY